MTTEGTGTKTPRASVSSDPEFQAVQATLAQVVEQLRRMTEAQQAGTAPGHSSAPAPRDATDDQMDTDPDHRRPLYRPKIELPKFEADSISSAKSFVRVARRLANLYDDDAYLITYASVRFGERAANWFERWEASTPLPEQSFKRLIDDFELQYIHSKELNESILNQLLDATQRGSIEQFYDFMSSKALALAKRPDEEILIRIFTKGITDDRIRQEVSRAAPVTLEAAYKAALRHRLALNITRAPRPPHPRPMPVPRKSPTTQAPTTGPPVPRLAKLDDATRNMCLEQKLCFKCRQPGHMASQCPSRNFRPGGAPRR
jgi:hypothetical protein